MNVNLTRRSVWRRVASREMLFVALLGTAGVVFVAWLQLVHFGWPDQFARRVVSALAFAYCITTILALSLLRLAPRFADKHFYVRWPLLAATITVSTLLGFCLAVFILTTLGVRPRDYRTWVDLPEDVLTALGIAFALGVGGHLYETTRARLDAATLRLRTAELERERERKLAAEASLASLESRVHPHFLFNTLNSISGLIGEDPPLAERMVERLAALLRFSLDSGARSVVALEQELKITTDYLEIERVRFGERLRYRVEVPPDLLSVLVPPLTLQTLVENSIKHVAARRPGGIALHVIGRREGGGARLEVRDDGPGFAREAITPGRGLDNLQARLRTLFGDEAALDVSHAADGMSCVSVSLPAPPAAPSGEAARGGEFAARASGAPS